MEHCDRELCQKNVEISSDLGSTNIAKRKTFIFSAGQLLYSNDSSISSVYNYNHLWYCSATLMICTIMVSILIHTDKVIKS